MKNLDVSSPPAGLALSVQAEEEEEEEEEGCCKPIPSLAICVLIPLFLLGFSVSIFILVLVHNALFFLSLLLLFALVLSFIFWNILSRHRSKTAPIFAFLQAFPLSDLVVAQDGQLVKVSGRLSTDFYITDSKSGSRIMVNAGSGCKLIPLVKESSLVNRTKPCRPVSSSLTKWLQDRNLSTEPRPLLLREGYVQEGDMVTVIGKLQKNNGVLLIVEPEDVISTGCIWKKLLLPAEADGMILAA